MSVALRQQEPAELRLEVIEGRDGFVGLERSWNDALGKGPRDEPMLRHEWLRAFLENFFPGATVRTFVARAGREIAAAVPLIETRERRSLNETRNCEIAQLRATATGSGDRKSTARNWSRAKNANRRFPDWRSV